MSINLSYYDLTNVDWKADANNDGLIDQSGSWNPRGFALKRASFGIGENRVKHRGNSQTLTVDKRVKKWGVFDLEYLLVKYEASPSPAWNWWDLVQQCFYGAATGAPATRPQGVYLGAKYNRATPEFWTMANAKASQLVIKGSMVTDAITLALQGMARYVRFGTVDYVGGTATRRADPAKTPIVPASDCLIKINNVDVSTLIQEFTITLNRGLEGRGKAATVTDDSSHIGATGEQYREIVPNTFDGRFDFVLDPFGTASTDVINQINDTALNTCEIRIPNETNGKNIQFTASKINDLANPHAEGQSPSPVNLGIDGATFNVATL